MKAIYSPFDDENFNDFLYKYIKKRLTKKALLFQCKYTYEDKEYTPSDIIKTLNRKNRIIYFSNMQLINYVVYDLSQRFWFEELQQINNRIYQLKMIYTKIKIKKEQESANNSENQV